MYSCIAADSWHKLMFNICFWSTLPLEIDQAPGFLFLGFIVLYVFNSINVGVYVLCLIVINLSVCLCVSLGKRLTRQESQKHFFNFAWPNTLNYLTNTSHVVIG